jgi:hypothetical protein
LNAAAGDQRVREKEKSLSTLDVRFEVRPHERETRGALVGRCSKKCERLRRRKHAGVAPRFDHVSADSATVPSNARPSIRTPSSVVNGATAA